MRFGDYIGVSQKNADLGIEIEIETSSNEGFPLVKDWEGHPDGSLRGNSIEYVSRPIKFSETDKHIDTLLSALKNSGIPINNSIRTGIHIHLNYLDKNMDDVIKFVGLYCIFERALLRFCGKNREYNLFCRPFIDSEYAAVRLVEAKSVGLGALNTDNLRYCALNLRSLIVHGTIEFRSMETRKDLDGLKTWISLIECLQNKSEKYSDLNEILEQFSLSKCKEFSEDVFGKQVKHLIINEGEMFQGMRMAQDINYGSL